MNLNSSRVPGFPDIGPTIPAAALTGLGALAGVVGAWAAVGLSPWLVISLLLVLAAAVGPRGPFAAILIAQLAVAVVVTGQPGYTGRFVVVLVATHLLFAIGSLTAWVPTGARVQLAVLRRPVLRFVGVQVAAQVVAFVVLTLIAPHGDGGPAASGVDAIGSVGGSTGLVWLGIVGAAAAVVMAVVVLSPVLLRPDAEAPRRD